MNVSPISGISQEELEQIRKIMGPSAAAFFDNLPDDVNMEELMAAMAMPLGDQPDDQNGVTVHPGEYRIGPCLDGEESPETQTEGYPNVRNR